MENLHSFIKTSQLLRVAAKENVEMCWNSKSLQFSCAANWIHYARDNQTIGDPYECVFSRVPRGKHVHIVDRYGEPIECNLQRIPDKQDFRYEFLRYVPTMLTPAMCFFSFADAKPNGIFHDAYNDYQSKFYLYKYAQYMGYTPSKAAVLFIEDVPSFIKEMETQTQIAIRANRSNLTQGRYYVNKNPNEQLCFGGHIDYNKFQRYSEFDERPNPPEELFWKFQEYKEQNEVRIVIMHWNFIQEYDPYNHEAYDHTKNCLKVDLPHLHEYARYIPLK